MDIPLTLSLNSEAIIDNLAQESIDAYIFLRDQFEATQDIRINHLFHFVFRSFYRLDNAGLSNDMKLEYFNLMQELRRDDEFDFHLVCRRLYDIPNLKGQNSLQYSFTTKMANMVSPHYPIYDSEVAAMFGFKAPHNYKSYDQRINEYSAFYSDMTEQYIAFSQDERLLNVFESFAIQRNNVLDISTIKKLDFLMWSAGKLQNKGLLAIA